MPAAARKPLAKAATLSGAAVQPAKHLPGRMALVNAPSFQTRNGQFRILLPVIGPMPKPHFHLLQHPRRWYVDLQPAEKLATAGKWPGNGWFKDARLGQFEPQVVRLVLDLSATSAYPHLVALRHGFLILAGKSPAALKTPARPARARRRRRMAARAHPMHPFHPAHKPRRTIAATRPTKAMAAARPAAVHYTSVRTKITARAAMPAANPAPARPLPAQAAAAPAQPRIPASLLHPSRLSRASVKTPPQYTGERITLRLKNADLKDFFRIVHEISGLNVIVDPDVTGTVTMMMRNVPWDQAFALVIHNYQLGYQLQGNVLRISRLSTLIAEAKQRAQFRQATESQAPLVTVLWHLNYISAVSVAGFLGPDKSLMGRRGKLVPKQSSLATPVSAMMPGQSVQIQAQKQPATLLIIAAENRIAAIEKMIRQLDHHRPQVELTARIVQTSRSYARDIGVQLGMLLQNAATIASGVPAVGIAPLSGAPLNTNLGATGPTSGISIINASSQYQLQAILTAAENRGLGHILSSPKVITQDNQAASIVQGVQFAMQTNNGLAGPTNTLQNATLELDVVPRIAPNGKILLSVIVVNRQIDQGISFVGEPAVDIQGTSAHVLISNGATLMLGGVMVHNRQRNVAQVPLLGDVPMVGNLFRHTSIIKSDQELLFFITPKILQ